MQVYASTGVTDGARPLRLRDLHQRRRSPTGRASARHSERGMNGHSGSEASASPVAS